MPQSYTATQTFNREIGKQILVLRCAAPEMECVIVPDLGFNVISWTYGGKELIGYDREALVQPGLTGCPMLFPFPNRVRDAAYAFGGKQYRQVKNGRDIVLHGLVWDEPFQSKLTTGDDCARAQGFVAFDNPHLLEGYPFPCILTLRCELNSTGLSISYHVQNAGTATMPFGFAIHPYFVRVDGEATQVQIPAATRYETTPDLLPTGVLLPTAGTRYNLSSPTPASGQEFDDVFCELSGPCAILHPQSKLRVTLNATPDFQHVVYYSTATLPRFFCVENQTCSTNAINISQRCKTSNLLTLAPGKTHSGRVDMVVTAL